MVADVAAEVLKPAESLTMAEVHERLIANKTMAPATGVMSQPGDEWS